VLASLRAIFRRRQVEQPKIEPQVLVTIECPWEDNPIRRFGSVEDVLGDRTLDEVVRMVASENAGKEDSLPEAYAISVRREDSEEFDPADRRAPARSFLGDGAESPGRAVYQLRIQIVPICDETPPGRPHQQRHSDLAFEAAPTASTADRPMSPTACEAGPARPRGEAAPAAEAAAQSAAPAPEVGKKPRGYLRKADVLRAQLLPKIEALDLRGLFVGNFGLQLEAPVTSPRVSLLSPTEANRYLMQANQHRRDGDHDEAARCYRTLIAHDPDNKDYWFLLGKVEETRGEFGQAVHAYQNALRLGHASARAEIARIESEHGQVAAGPRDLMSMWRLTYPPAQPRTGGK
jgi:hypothetical protein